MTGKSAADHNRRRRTAEPPRTDRIPGTAPARPAAAIAPWRARPWLILAGSALVVALAAGLPIALALRAGGHPVARSSAPPAAPAPDATHAPDALDGAGRLPPSPTARDAADEEPAHDLSRLAAAHPAVAAELATVMSQARDPRSRQQTPDVAAMRAAAVYVGSKSCFECHREETIAWSGSDHELAMAAAEPFYVRGDFNDAEITHFGVTSKMFKRVDEETGRTRFFITTSGIGGKIETFEIAYTLGIRPLQQYMVKFDDGRIQCLPIAWNTEKKEWFHLYPEDNLSPDEWLYWTNRGQNFNYMCADCHTTDYRKNYDLATDTYHSTWSDINVGCESCHGPGSAHVEWAEKELQRVGVEDPYHFVSSQYQNPDRPFFEFNTCSKCHSRRTPIDEGFKPGDDYHDFYLPERLEADLYYPDGQVYDEVFVRGSFWQSRMFREHVRCTDCHDPHSTKLKYEGNRLCTQCHVAAAYDTPKHHFHEQGTPASLCVECHMTDRTYMIVDPRRDHGMHIPRPDLTMKIGVPNACNRCHIAAGETPQWAADWIVEWYGEKRVHDPHFGEILAPARANEPDAAPGLIALLRDRDNTGPIVRATAAALLANYPLPESVSALGDALTDEDPHVRSSAIEALDLIAPPEELLQLVKPMLNDARRVVRIEAARVLARFPVDSFDPRERLARETAIAEFVETQMYAAEQPAAHLNLGVLAVNLNKPEEAFEAYQTALRLDPNFHQARFNLAMLEYQLGDRAAAEQQLREVIDRTRGDLAEAWYSLGLLLAEDPARLGEAVEAFDRAVQVDQSVAVYHYHLGIARMQQADWDKAETALRDAIHLSPEDPGIAYALMSLYFQLENWDQVLTWVDRLIELDAANPQWPALRRQVEQRRRGADGG